MKIWAIFIIGQNTILGQNTIHTHKNILKTKVKEDLEKQEFVLLKMRITVTATLKSNLQCLVKLEKIQML